MAPLLLLLLGTAVGTLSSLIGLGGGFIIVPLLMSTHPHLSAAEITSVSMLCILVNSLSGSLGNLLRKRISLKIGLAFAIAAIPGAYPGTLLTRYVPINHFQLAFGFVMLLLGSFTLYKSQQSKKSKIHEDHIIDHKKIYIKGVPLSTAIAFMASFLGIGGGVLRVPLMIHWLKMPVTLSTATSQFILFFTALISTLAHFQQGDFPQEMSSFLFLAVGMALGGQLAPFWAPKIKGHHIQRLLAVAIFIVALKLLWPLWKIFS